MLTIWLVGVLLLALNFPILRLMEGYPLLRAIELYGRLHPAGKQWLSKKVRRRFERKARPPLETQAIIDSVRAAGKPDPIMPKDHATKLALATTCYPDDSTYVLPTRFGNLFRAFEVYPRVLYGLDAIPAWTRLQAIMPKEAWVLLADAKAQLDFCVNLTVVSVVASASYIALAICRENYAYPWFLLLTFGIALFGYWLAINAAAQFGNYVRSAFDLYRGDLARALGLDLPSSIEDERQMWQIVSRMMIYRSAARATELSRFRSKPSSRTNKVRVDSCDEP